MPTLNLEHGILQDMTNVHFREQAITLRREGKTYSEILARIPVAKSTLSLWLRDVGLSKPQIQRITEKRVQARLRGAFRKREIRESLTKEILDLSTKEIGTVSFRELWLIGVALYWAEGSKEKVYRPTCGVKFTNGDPTMIRVFLSWLQTVCKIKPDEIIFEIYIHENTPHPVAEIKEYWSEQTGFSTSFFTRIYYKKNKLSKTKRRNVGALYYGLVRVTIRRSSTLNRKIAGWTQGIIENWGVV